MTSTVIADERRQRRAAAALEALGRHRADRQVLLVECQGGHALAAVYSTCAGLVVVSFPRPVMLDQRDLAGMQHHRRTRPGREFVDMLDATWADDDLPTGCYCGNHTLSRMELGSSLSAGRRLITIR